ncbi:DNA excision repair protein ERCC-6-like [Bacillus rossius redtenbacheri]|uniref:DNA excision repair protein ERCC-6-like n=1 Tax=Bacillus rossius redtenbacheri TaxID=93214 RepID=UPI002FDDC4CD
MEEVNIVTDAHTSVEESEDNNVTNGLEEEAIELQALGLSVYDQEDLEQGILNHVDEVVKQQKQNEAKNKLDKAFKEVCDEISACGEDIKRSEALLDEAGCQPGTRPAHVRKNVEIKRKQLVSLHARQQHLQKQLQNLDSGEPIEADGAGPAESSSDALLLGKQPVESEMERKIRLGEMTPFGSTLSTSRALPVKELTEFEKYLLDQSKQQMRKKNSAKAQTKNAVHVGDSMPVKKSPRERASPLKKCILQPKKRKKKVNLGTWTSEDYRDQNRKPEKPMSETVPLDDSEGSEYLPSEEEWEQMQREEKGSRHKAPKKSQPKKRQCKKKSSTHPETWDSDDSDWEYSDEESRAKRRSKSRKEIDDGNLEDFQERLKLWEERQAREGAADDGSPHELENGLKVPAQLWGKLYSYQRVGVQWLWELNQQQCGGILGDEMGLGKTVQVIAFLAALSHSKLLTHHNSFRGVGPCLIVCPTTMMHQWVQEFHTWWPPFRIAVLHESGSFIGKRETLIGHINSRNGILVTSYVGVVQHQDALLSKAWHYVILDEGHKIRNPDAKVTLAVKQFRTPHRVILSGSPLQNNLKELWSLFDFIFPGKLGTLPVFLAQLAVPITQGGYANASQVEVATAYKCATVLRDTIAPYLLRRMKADVKSHINLPPKSEQVLFCKLTEEQRRHYKAYLESGEVERILHGHARIFVGLINLRKICNHPDLYSGGTKLFAGDSALPEEESYGYWGKAGKMIVIESLLKIWKKQGHRVLLFTQSRQMLCIMESFVQKQGYSYLKLDGGTSISARQPLIKKFNEDPSCFVFLLTTRVGGLGVNLTGADRVVIYDPDWNPATDTQARERAWRIGQRNRVTVYRLITAGTIEEKVYHRQIFKQFLTNRVLEDPKQRRFFKSNDLFELFMLKESDKDGSTETAAIFAGTGSEVKLKPHNKNADKSKQKVKLYSSKTSSGSFMENDILPLGKTNCPAFSQAKLENMKKLAELLSKKFSLHCQKKETVESISEVVIPELVETANESQAGAVPVQIMESCSDVPNVTLSGDIPATSDVDAADADQQRIIACPPSACAVENFHESLGDLQECRDAVTIINVEKSEIISTEYDDSERSRKEKANKGVGKSRANKIDYSSMQHQGGMKKHHSKTLGGTGKVSPTERHNHHKRKRDHDRKHRKRKKMKEMLFEGERVPHLVGQETTAKPSRSDDEERNAEHDDYVLRKLFKKSGLQTALRHDTIMEKGHSDYALVEGEAQRVAQEAVKALRESRQQCWRAGSGVPSWTGQSGAVRLPSGMRFGKKKAAQRNSTATSSHGGIGQPSTSGGSARKDDAPMSSSELLARIRARNRLTTPADDLPLRPAPPDDDTELLADIRNFVAFGATVDGRASTQEVVERFQDRLLAGSSPLFKFLLQEICDFHRMPSGEGVWRLKADFRW